MRTLLLAELLRAALALMPCASDRPVAVPAPIETVVVLDAVAAG